MDRKAQKKNAQQALNIKNRHSRFITEYVSRKHPQLYTEADTFFKKLKAANPNKRDLTKTHEFLVETTKYTDYREFYCRKKLKVHRKEQTVTTTTTTTTTMKNNMELNVELLTPEVVKANTTNPFLPIPDDTYQDLLGQIRKDPALQTILDDMTAPPNVDEQVDDLVNDPELQEIFDPLQETPLERELRK